MEKRKRIVTKIGDLFSVDLDGKTKRFFQYVAIDESMLGGSVIRVFKRKYDIDAEPSFDEIVNDEVDFYTHTSLKIGIQEEYWQKIGRNLNVGDTENISTCTVEHPLSACHPIAYFPLSNPSFHFSVDYCCSNNGKCSASLS